MRLEVSEEELDLIVKSLIYYAKNHPGHRRRARELRDRIAMEGS